MSNIENNSRPPFPNLSVLVEKTYSVFCSQNIRVGDSEEKVGGYKVVDAASDLINGLILERITVPQLFASLTRQTSFTPDEVYEHYKKVRSNEEMDYFLKEVSISIVDLEVKKAFPGAVDQEAIRDLINSEGSILD
jgi:hypothetical protein